MEGKKEEIMQTIPIQYTGRKAKVGGICFDNTDRLKVFVNYCPGCNAKVVMTLDEARQFANKYSAETNRVTFKKIMKAKVKLQI